MPDLAPYPGTARWVKVSGIVAVFLTLSVAFVVLGGGGPHGPGRHAAVADGAGHGRWELFAILGVLLVSSVALNWGWLADAGILPKLGKLPLGQGQAGATRLPTMSSTLRKLVLVVHVASSVGSLGAVLVFLTLAIAGLSSEDAQTTRGVYIAMDLTARFVIVPLLLVSFLVGLVQALSTPWGLFRHYWVLVKFLLTALTIVVLLLQMEGIASVAAVAANTALSSADLLELRRSIRTHAAGGIVVLLTLVALSIYKPRGITRYGWRRQRQ